jgi:hypothetical protein
MALFAILSGNIGSFNGLYIENMVKINVLVKNHP